jgi:hypothetical protein
MWIRSTFLPKRNCDTMDIKEMRRKISHCCGGKQDHYNKQDHYKNSLNVKLWDNYWTDFAEVKIAWHNVDTLYISAETELWYDGY